MLTVHVAEPAKPEWMTLRPANGDLPAVEIHLKPADSAMRIAGNLALAKLYRSPEGEPLPTPDRADIEIVFNAGAIHWAALAWKGIGDEGGEPLPITLDTVEALLRQHYDIHKKLDDEYVVPFLQGEAEKNVSSPSPSGASAEATTTAAPARPPAPSAQPE